MTVAITMSSLLCLSFSLSPYNRFLIRERVEKVLVPFFSRSDLKTLEKTGKLPSSLTLVTLAIETKRKKERREEEEEMFTVLCFLLLPPFLLLPFPHRFAYV
jgi:hypothetical protein